ncbi:MAG: dephospho-CoA kinase, partial [Acidobacteriota bacterium]
MLRIGLTGGLASGKSTVASFLARLGAAVFDADSIVARLYDPGAAGEAVVRELFGSEVEDERGAVDRARIARIVFGDPAARR